MTISRIREAVSHTFECYIEFNSQSKEVIKKYPADYDNTETLRNAASFCFPLSAKLSNQYFSFTTTNSLESLFTFGFCYHEENSALCFISYLPWFDFFHQILMTIKNLRNIEQYKDSLLDILNSLYNQPPPAPGPFSLDAKSIKCNLQIPNHISGLPSVPEQRNNTKFLECITGKCLFTLYIALLNERRILLMSSSLDNLSAGVYAARDLIYPMYWQHVFIPVLPESLLEYVAAPMPLLIGLHRSLRDRAQSLWGEEIVIVDLDNNEMLAPPSLISEDIKLVPQSIRNSLGDGINGIKKLMETEQYHKIGPRLSKLFCVTLVALVGNYRGSCRFQNSKTFLFDSDHFLESRPQSLQDFIAKLLRCQHFTEFIEERLQILQGKKQRDIYEELSLEYYNTGNTKNYLKSWINDEIMKELNPELAMLKTGAFAFQDLIQDFNRGTTISTPKHVQATVVQGSLHRTAPPKPIPFHQYKHTIPDLPDFLLDPTIPPPTIDDKIFNLLIGNYDKITPSNHQEDFIRTHSLVSRSSISRPHRPISRAKTASPNKQQVPTRPSPTPSMPASNNSRPNQQAPIRPNPPVSLLNERSTPGQPAVGELISLDDDK